MASELVLDSGALIAAENRKRRFLAVWTDAFVNRGIVPIVPAPVVAQYWRGGAGKQSQGAKILGACIVENLDQDLAKTVGKLLGQSGTADVVDASVAVIADRYSATILTSDPLDIRKLLDTLNSKCGIIEV